MAGREPARCTAASPARSQQGPQRRLDQCGDGNPRSQATPNDAVAVDYDHPWLIREPPRFKRRGQVLRRGRRWPEVLSREELFDVDEIRPPGSISFEHEELFIHHWTARLALTEERRREGHDCRLAVSEGLVE